MSDAFDDEAASSASHGYQGPSWLPWLAIPSLALTVIGLAYTFARDGESTYFLYAVFLSAGLVAGWLIERHLARARLRHALESQAERERLAKELRRREAVETHRRHGLTHTFKPGEDDSYNQEFYTFFKQKLIQAKKSIYITGEGFECPDEEGTRFAQEFADAHALALSQNPHLHIDRIQTKALISKPWADMLQSLLLRFPGRFDLTLEPRRKDRGPIVSVCVIDPDSDVDNTVELMVSVNRVVRGEMATRAGIAFFHEHDKEFAGDMLDKIREARGLAGRRRITSIDESCGQWVTVGDRPHFEFDTAPLEPAAEDGALFYFSYGSNMDPAQMERRCKSAVRKGMGVLVGHRLVFNRKGDYVEGGVASVVKDANRNVQGMVYALSADDLERLDAAEIATSYQRVSRSLLLLDGTQVNCFVYEAYPQGEMAADQGYLERIIDAAERVSLDPEYVDSLKEFRT